MELPDAIARQLAAITGAKVTGSRPVGGGYTVALRWVVQLENGTSAFVKYATDDDTAGWLRDELKAYRAISADFMPKLYGSGVATYPLMILEDLSTAKWSWEWSDENVQRVLHLLERVRETPVPADLPSLTEMSPDLRGWREIQDDPRPFLGLGLSSAAWLERYLPVLVQAEADIRLKGDALVHVDMRSDNLCFTRDRTYLVDWNWARRGNPNFDLIAWLPSLHAEGGPAPWNITLDEPELISTIAGFYAVRAPKPPHKQGPAIRQMQLRFLRSALPWAAKALGLPHPEQG